MKTPSVLKHRRGEQVTQAGRPNALSEQQHSTATRRSPKERVNMVCPHCQSENVKANGKHRNGTQRFKCRDCKKTFTENRVRPLGSMRLPLDKAVSILKLLLDGMSIRACERFTDIWLSLNSVNRNDHDRQ
jgi:transposase-like protein